MEKFYTVDEVAIMTGLTSRTIRTYIKDGVLKGKKVGVQWRFTDAEVKELFKDKNVEREVSDAKNKLIYDFLEKREADTEKSCMVVDCPLKSEAEEEKLREELMEFINSYQWGSKFQFSYQLFKDEKIARFIISGSLKEALKIIHIIDDFTGNKNESEE